MTLTEPHLVDSSAWIELLRATGSPTANATRQLLRSAEARTCHVVRLEVLAGARSDNEELRLFASLAAIPLLPISGEHHESAARLHRACRAQGQTVRSLFDCLIAAVAIAHDVPVLHNDVDYDVLARHTPLRATRG